MASLRAFGTISANANTITGTTVTAQLALTLAQVRVLSELMQPATL